MKMKIFIILIIGLFSITSAKSQFDEIYISSGLTGTNIFTDNPATMPIFEKDKNKAFIIGGSFDGVETGTMIKGEFSIDNRATLFIPISFEYVWFNANEIVWPTWDKKIYLEHCVDAQKFSTGLKWYFYQFPFQNVKPYIGFEMKAIFFNNQTFSNQLHYLGNDSIVDIKQTTKKSAFRMGGEAMIGFRGGIFDRFYLSGSLGYEILNLIGRDNARGELLTPFPQAETEEKYVPNWHITLLIEYNI